MTILVTGANGQLGNELRIAAGERSEKFIFTDVREVPDRETVILDITDRDAVGKMVSDNDVKIIINCAAYTDVDRAEDDKETCATLNTIAPSILAEAAKGQNALLIHISTDYVFGGDRRSMPYDETVKGNPTSVYGQTKLEGENAVTSSGCDHVIIRTAWLYSEFGKNFMKTILRLASQKPRLNVVSDQIGTPTYALDLAEVICKVIDDYTLSQHDGPYRKNGVYHYSNEGVCSWFDFAKKILEISGNLSCEIYPCSSDEFPSKVKRPAYSVLDKTKITNTFGISVPHWTASLEKCYRSWSLLGE